MTLTSACEDKADETKTFRWELMKYEKTVLTGGKTEIPISFKGKGVYSWKYSKLHSEGRLLLDGKELEPDRAYSLDSQQVLKFVYTNPHAVDELLVFSAMDASGSQRVAVARITVAEPDFSITAQPVTSSFYVGQQAQIKLQIGEKSTGPAKKSLKLLSSDVKGVLTYDGRPYDIGREIPIGEQTEITLEFKALQSGTGVLKFGFGHGDAIQEVGVPLTVSLSFEVVKSGDPSAVYVGQATGLAFRITNQGGVSTPKKFRLVSGDLKGRLTYGGKTYDAGDPIPIGEQTEIQAEFTGLGSGQGPVLFEFSDDDFTQAKQVSLPMHIKPSFEVEMIPTIVEDGELFPRVVIPSITPVERGFVLRFNIEQKFKGGQPITKEFLFKSSKNAQVALVPLNPKADEKAIKKALESKPTYYDQEVEIPFNSQSFLLHFKPLALGDVKAIFTIQRGTEKQAFEANFMVNGFKPQLDVSKAAPTGGTPAKHPIFIQVSSLSNTPMIYQWRYTVSGTGAGKIEGVEPDTFTDIATAQPIKLNYVPESGASGEHQLNITVRDAYDMEAHKVVRLNIN